MPGKKIQVCINGMESGCKTLSIDEDASIESLLTAATEKTGIERDEQRLIYLTKQLQSTDKDGKPLYLRDYNIQDNAQLVHVIRVHGGLGETKQQKTYNSSQGRHTS